MTSTAIRTSFPRTLSMRPAGALLVTLAVSTTAYGAGVHSRCRVIGALWLASETRGLSGSLRDGSVRQQRRFTALNSPSRVHRPVSPECGSSR